MITTIKEKLVQREIRKLPPVEPLSQVFLNAVKDPKRIAILKGGVEIPADEQMRAIRLIDTYFRKAEIVLMNPTDWESADLNKIGLPRSELIEKLDREYEFIIDFGTGFSYIRTYLMGRLRGFVKVRLFDLEDVHMVTNLTILQDSTNICDRAAGLLERIKQMADQRLFQTVTVSE